VQRTRFATRGLVEPGKEESMVAKKGKNTKKVKDLSLKKLTSAQAKKIKGGGGHKGWIEIGSVQK
jgi:hypothetical protein